MSTSYSSLEKAVAARDNRQQTAVRLDRYLLFWGNMGMGSCGCLEMNVSLRLLLQFGSGGY
jgi:hypothetical protein